MTGTAKVIIVVVAGFALLAGSGMGVLIGLSLRSDEGVAVAPPAPETGPGDRSPDAPGDLSARVGALEKEVRKRDERIEALESENSAMKSPSPEAPAASEGHSRLVEENKQLKERIAELEILAEPKPRPREIYRFGLNKETPFLDKADWKELSGQLVGLKSGVRDFFDEFRSKGDITLKTRLALQKQNQPLLIFAVGASKEAEGLSVNSAFTHPAIVANLIRSVLERAGDPLTEEQDAAVRGYGDEWVTREAARKQRYTEETLAMTKMIEEVDSRQEFLNEVRSLLTESQQAIIYDPEIDGRGSLDLFSPALNYAFRKPVNAPTREALEKKLVKEFFELLGLAHNPDEYTWIGAEWLDKIPESLEPVSEEEHRIDLAFPKLEKLQRSARAQAWAMLRLIETKTLDEEQVRMLRGLTMLGVPQVVKEKGEH